MVRNVSLGILGLVLLFLVLQIAVGKYTPQPIWGILWVVLAIVPVLGAVLLGKQYFTTGYFLFYAVLLLLTMLGQGVIYRLQGTGALSYIKLSFAWVLPAQVLLWVFGRGVGEKKPTRARPAPLDPTVIQTILEDLLPQDLTEDALQLLAQQPGLLPDERKTLRLIQARNAALQQQIIKNLIEPAVAGRERAQINDALLSLLDQM
jgi:hypothetical protein